MASQSLSWLEICPNPSRTNRDLYVYLGDEVDISSRKENDNTIVQTNEIVSTINLARFKSSEINSVQHVISS